MLAHLEEAGHVADKHKVTKVPDPLREHDKRLALRHAGEVVPDVGKGPHVAVRGVAVEPHVKVAA